MSYPPSVRRFIVAGSELRPEAQRAFVQMLTDAGSGWWSWVPGMWLVVDASRRWTMESLRAALAGVSPTSTVFVMRVRDVAGWTANAPEEALAWLTDSWR